MSINNRLLKSTADIAATLDGAIPPEGRAARTTQSRTGPGLMLGAREAMTALQAEIDEMRQRLQQFDGSTPTLLVDPHNIRTTRWANRHEASFASPAFERLKASIAVAGGNVQPILVRRVALGAYEVVFGHRRHRACLELGLPVLTVVWNKPMSDVDLFASMDRENREREDPSAYEQGASYLAAIGGGMFPSQRRLAETLGVSHTWVRKAISVAQLPAAIIQAFSSPLDVQPRHAEALRAALERDPDAVLLRAAQIRMHRDGLTASQVVAQLLGRSAPAAPVRQLIVDGHAVGTYRPDGRGKMIVAINLASIERRALSAVGEAVAAALALTPVNATDMSN